MELSEKQIQQYMELAIAEMKKSVLESRSDKKHVPKVGAVLVWKDGDTLRVTCAHRGELRNGDHAEYTLLDRKLRDKDLTDAILFATLEPCAPGARRPPKCSCAERIVNARISKVYFGIQDPDPSVSGKGIQFLQENGVDIHIFSKELQDIIKENNAEFLMQAEERALLAAKETIDENTIDVSINELSENALNFYANRIGITDKEATLAHLEKNGLILKNQDGIPYPTKDCLILFGNNPPEKCKGAYISIITRGKYAFGDAIKQICGPMVLALDTLEKWFVESVPNQSFDLSMNRSTENQPLFRIFREAVANAIMHRDYSIEGSSIIIILSDDLIEVKSPGSPPAPVTMEQLNTFSAPALSRNPAISFVFRELKYAENIGHGLDLMQETRSIGLPIPHYSFDGVYLTLSIPLSKESIATIFPELESLTPEDRSIMEFIRENTSITKAQLMEHFGLAEKTAQRRLSSLYKKGYIVGNGEAKNSRKYGYSLAKRFS